MSEMQKARVLSLLLAHRGEWVSSVDLSRLSLQYNARIFSLRRDGWEISRGSSASAAGTARSTGFTGYRRRVRPRLRRSARAWR
jgi:hypothetical protein